MKGWKRIYRLLTPAERKTSWKVIGTVGLGALLDVVGLAVLVPVLFFLLEGGEDRSTALLFCGGALGWLLLKDGCSVRLSQYQHRFLLAVYRRVSEALFTSYYDRGWLFIRRKGSVRMAYEVNFVCYAFALNLLAPWLRMTGDALLLCMVTVALLFYSPLTVLSLYLVFVPFLWVYNRVIRQRVKAYGEAELQARREQSSRVSETLQGYTELELNAAFGSVRQSFVAGVERISTCRLRLETVQRLPLCLSELGIVVGLTLLTAGGTGDLRMLTGVFAMASLRMLPALRGMLSGWTQVQNSSYCLRILEEGIDPEPTEGRQVPEGRELTFDKEIAVCGVSYAYPDGEQVFDHLTLHIRKGEYVGICGESGVGKSTLFCLLLGFLEPTRGEITVDGTRLDATTRAAWHRKVGYVQQEVYVRNSSLADNIALGAEVVDREKVWQTLRQVRLEEWAAALPQQIDTVLGEGGSRLSGGQKQRIGIARALYKEAEVLLLDEATSALDNATERAINEMLADIRKVQGGLTILSIAHRESSLAYCQRRMTLNRPS